MMSNPIVMFRTALSVATLSACVLSFAPMAHAGLLGGVTGGAGGTLSPRILDLQGQGRLNVVRDGPAQLPRGEKLRNAAGSAVDEAKGTLGEAKGAATNEAPQFPGTVTGTASGAATAGGAIAMDKAAAAKSGGAETSGTASASGNADVTREGSAVNASASGETGISR